MLNAPANLVLNVAPISFTRDTFLAGRLAYTGEDAYRSLRQEHWRTHAFRYDDRYKAILNVSIDGATPPLGTVEQVKISDNLLLAARAIQQSILIWICAKLPILRANKQLIFWGQADETLLLTKALKELGLEHISGLEVPVRYEVDCRMFLDHEEKPFLGLVVDVRTANVIDLPVSMLIAHGFAIEGKYICRRREADLTYVQPGLELVGQVYKSEFNNLKFTDADSTGECSADDALVEPRQEYFQEAIEALFPGHADAVLARLRGLRQPLASAAGKLAQIKSTLAGLKRHRLKIADGVEVAIGDLLESGAALFPDYIATERPTCLFGPQGRQSGAFPDAGIREWGPYLYMQHTRNMPLIGVVCEARHRGTVEQFMNALLNGYPDALFKGYGDNPFRAGLLGKFRLGRVKLEYENCSGPSSKEYASATRRLLERLAETPDLAVVQTRESFKELYGEANPYLVTKARFMMAGVPTQAVKIENMQMTSPQIPYLLNSVALASYAKLDGTPWLILTNQPSSHELIIGIGSAEVGAGRFSVRTRYVGITTLFQGDGRYLLWGLTREVEYDQYPTALLESLRTTVRYVESQNGWEAGDKVRLIFHVYKRLRDCEVEATKLLVHELVEGRYQVEFAFIDISSHHPYRLFDPSQRGAPAGRGKTKGKGFPERGICLQLDRRRALLHLKGPKDIKTEDQGLPPPLLLELHPDSDFVSLPYLARQMYHFTYASWQSFFPATDPVTIKYSRLIARLLGQMKPLPNWDSSVLAVGPLRGRRWFL